MGNVFSAEELLKVDEAVKAAEKRTSGEIVPVVAARSGNYGWLRHSLALTGLAGGTLVAIFIHYYRPFAAEWPVIFGAQAVGFALGWALGCAPAVVRALLGSSWVTEEVTEGAQLAFLRYNLFDTRQRTGVLIYLSLFEHRAVILADKGIHAKVGENYWKEEVEKITLGIREGRSGEALAAVVSEIGAKLAEHFPATAGDRNELADSVRVE